ncbi:short chain dehydrogenase [Acaromyces ingoldii]|uniref:Short chain dehydrogenase n=1 Tax=Acaromyces ingoldii TaxID=215250 RepID=A0A316YKN0_9BASI|nr:short chain dehydrogenase [Acaromyces ingoldii]PWN89769.1 short chain dehydrogenase [Acaromyces ingoldii]
MSAKLIALVSGGNNGVGLETCKQLAASGRFHVVMGSRSEDKARTAIETLGHKDITFVQLDITSDKSIRAAAQVVEHEWGRLDVLVNNAGICPLTFNREVMKEVLDVNCIGQGLMTEAFAPLLRASAAPRVIYISSLLGSIALRTDAKTPGHDEDYKAYRISKAALNMLTVCDAWEYPDFKVFAYSPSYVVSDLAGMRQAKIEQGAETPEGSAKGLLALASGERDGEAGQHLHDIGGPGVFSW